MCTILIPVNKNMRLMRERNVSQRLLFYTQKQMFDNEKKNSEKIILGVICFMSSSL